MRRFAVSILVAALIASLSVVLGATTGSASTTTASTTAPLGVSCAPYGGQSICSGSLPSFDGAPLDFDLTKPTNGESGQHPLIVMLHGFGNDKHEWESTNDVGDNADKWHWNSHWFASHGYYVLTYTARGFGAETQPASYNPATPSKTTCPAPNKGGSNCPALGGTIRVKNKNVEIRDTQWLAANVAKAFPAIHPQRVAVTGGSYGGGESWLQAAEPVWTFPQKVKPTLPVLTVQVAVPKYPWTDLAASLAPNGRVPNNGTDVYASSYGPPSDPGGRGTPFGVGKASYTTALQALGYSMGDFQPETFSTPQSTGPDPELDPLIEPFTAWQGRIAGTEPYSTGPRTDEEVIRQIRKAFSHWHSAYYRAESPNPDRPGWKAQVGHHQTAVFSISGWTDDLFPAIESFRMFTLLKKLDPQWPVAVRAADIGHARSQNKPGTWHRLNDQAFAFLQSQITGSHHATTTVASQATDCTSNAFPAPAEVSAASPAGLGLGTLTVRATRPAVLAPTSGAGDPDGARTDAVAGGALPLAPAGHGGCTVGTTPAPPAGAFGYRATSAPLTATRTTTGIGYVCASYSAGAVGGTSVVAARVWDVAPDKTPLLITRGVYRLDYLYGDPRTGMVKVPFYGNHWQLPAGHQLRLDLQQVDAPTYRPPTPAVTSPLTLSNISLVLPVRTAGAATLPAP